MRKILIVLLAFAGNITFYQSAQAQLCGGKLGPNLLGAKGTFSAPFITVNDRTGTDACLDAGTNTYNPIGNVGNALVGCGAAGTFAPCSGYTYVASNGGMQAEGTYSILKTIGDANGGNCIWPDWQARDHTGDGGYFLAVNGAPTTSVSPIFYQIKNIPVCPNTTYEFSAWVINILPSAKPHDANSEPNIAFYVDGVKIAESGVIAYQSTPTWIKVGGTFNSGSSTVVTLSVQNNTAARVGNDLGLDDIYIGVCDTKVSFNSGTSACVNRSYAINGTVDDNTGAYSWYKWQESTDGGTVYNDITSAAQGTFSGSTMNVSYVIPNVTNSMNGNLYRLVVANSAANLNSVACLYNNTWLLVVSNSCGPLPVKLGSFEGNLFRNVAQLSWYTETEIDNDYFTLYRSYNGKDFEAVARVQGKGNSTSRSYYTFVDSKIKNGAANVFYKLEQTDYSRNTAYSPIVRLSEMPTTTLGIFPNPVQHSFNINIQSTGNTTGVVKLINSEGRIVYQQRVRLNKGANSVLVSDVRSISSGLYIVELVTGEETYRTKLIKR